MKHLLFATSAIALLVACSPADTGAVETATSTSAPSATTLEADAPASTFTPVEVTTKGRDDWGEFGLDLASMNQDVHPGDNFFQHVNGAWIDTFEMPAEDSRTSLYGHDAFLKEWDAMAPRLAEFCEIL